MTSIELNALVLQLFLDPSSNLQPANNIAHAFVLAERIRQIVDAHPLLNTPARHISYLCLAQTQKGCWAASFHLHAFDDPEWYEAASIEALDYSARAPTPHLAIARAAAKCVPLLVPFLKQ